MKVRPCCFGTAILLTWTSAHTAPKISLNAAEEPTTKAWTQPASLTYISNENAKDSWVVDIAGKVEWQPSEQAETTLFTRAVVQRNTQPKKDAEQYAAEFGGHFEMNSTSTSYWLDTSAGIDHKSIAPDPSANCAAIPLPPPCTEQQQTSFVVRAALQPFRASWERVPAWKDATHTEMIRPAWTYLFLPVITLFHDKAFDAKRDANGFKADGAVTGAKAVISLSGSPEFSDYRLVLSAKAQYVNAFSRSVGRRPGFLQESTLVKVSADYELSKRSFALIDNTGWIPAIGVTYTKGDDPQTGQLDQDSVTFGFKLTYKPPG